MFMIKEYPQSIDTEMNKSVRFRAADLKGNFNQDQSEKIRAIGICLAVLYIEVGWLGR